MSCAQHGFVVNELSQSHLHLWQCSSLQIISFRGLLWRLKILQNVVFLFGGQFYIQLLNLKRNSRINNHRGDLKC